jgi:hypothetical protein
MLIIASTRTCAHACPVPAYAKQSHARPGLPHAQPDPPRTRTRKGTIARFFVSYGILIKMRLLGPNPRMGVGGGAVGFIAPRLAGPSSLAGSGGAAQGSVRGGGGGGGRGGNGRRGRARANHGGPTQPFLRAQVSTALPFLRAQVSTALPMAWAPSAEWIFKHPQHTLKVCEFRGKCFFGLEVLFCSIGLPAGVG